MIMEGGCLAFFLVESVNTVLASVVAWFFTFKPSLKKLPA